MGNNEQNESGKEKMVVSRRQILKCAIGAGLMISAGRAVPEFAIDAFAAVAPRKSNIDTIVDVHCHLFNVQYAVMELAAVTWNYVWGNYPHREREGDKRFIPKDVLKNLEGIRDFAGWVARLVDVALSGSEEILDTARKEFSGSNINAKRLVVVPLMMDIYFSWDDNRNEEAEKNAIPRKSSSKVFAIAENQMKDFDDHFNEVVRLIRDEVPDIKRGFLDDKLTDVFASSKKALLAHSEETRKGGEYEDIELSPGYKKHMQDLENLSSKYPDTVFPFLAVDPRRIGIMKLIDMKINKGNGVFKGIKLYTPLGYLPTHPNLNEVFRYCVENDIPITVHCSQADIIHNFRGRNYVVDWSGNNHWENFGSTNGDKTRYYAAPEKWVPVLEKWPKLRINFAHFGGGDSILSGQTEWMCNLIAILKKYENAYTDISYFSKKGLDREVALIIKLHEILKERLMFGTDYVMLMLDSDLGGLKPYYDRFSVFDDNVLSKNARNFLRLTRDSFSG